MYDSNPYQQNQYQQNNYQQNGYQQNPYQPNPLPQPRQPQNAVEYTLRELAKSPLYMTAIIAFSVYVLFGLVRGLAGGNALNQILYQVMDLTGGYNYELERVLGAYGRSVAVVTIIGMIPAILYTVGMWLAFASAKTPNYKGLNPLGLKFTRILAIIQLVLICIVGVFFELILAIAMAGVGSMVGAFGGNSSGTTGIFALLMLLVAGVVAVEIIYFLKLAKLAKNMETVVLTNVANADVSSFIEIMCYVFGVCEALSALGSLVGFSAYGFLAGAGQATASIAFGIFLRKYRSSMLLLLGSTAPMQRNDSVGYDPNGYQNGYANAAYGQQEYQNPQYQQMNDQAVYAQQEAMRQEQERQRQAELYRQEQERQQQMAAARQQVQANVQQENETEVLPYYNETSVLTGQFQAGGQTQLVRMTRQKTNETFVISKPSFWIGKDAANVDYCITDNTAISRRHALITIQNNQCYIRDNHATNGTFINGQRINSDEDVLLNQGDHIRLSDEEFVVSIG